MERADQGRAINHIELGCNDHNKDNQRREKWADKIEVRILYQIGSDHSKHIRLDQEGQTKIEQRRWEKEEWRG